MQITVVAYSCVLVRICGATWLWYILLLLTSSFLCFFNIACMCVWFFTKFLWALWPTLDCLSSFCLTLRFLSITNVSRVYLPIMHRLTPSDETTIMYWRVWIISFYRRLFRWQSDERGQSHSLKLLFVFWVQIPWSSAGMGKLSAERPSSRRGCCCDYTVLLDGCHLLLNVELLDNMLE